jgi:hypothetical protein
MPLYIERVLRKSFDGINIGLHDGGAAIVNSYFLRQHPLLWLLMFAAYQ